MLFIFIVHLAATSVMAGLIWTIQLLHYPFFHHLEKHTFAQQMKVHRTKISFIVIPVMLLELITGFYLLIVSTEFSLHFSAGFVMIVLIWLSTFLFQMRSHNQIAEEYDSSAVNTLIRTNWIRTLLWSIRLFLLLYIASRISFPTTY